MYRVIVKIKNFVKLNENCTNLTTLIVNLIKSKCNRYGFKKLINHFFEVSCDFNKLIITNPFV